MATARVDYFKSTNPNVQVKATEGGFDEQQFLSAVASGQPPDLVYLSRDELGTYAARGAIVPLDDCVAKEGIDLNQFRPAAVQQVKLDGKVYGIPEFYQSRILLIDTTALDKAGVAREDVSTTDWAKLATVNEQLTERSGGKLQRIGFDPKLPEFLPLWGQGQRRVDPERRRPHGPARQPQGDRGARLHRRADQGPGRLGQAQGVQGQLRLLRRRQRVRQGPARRDADGGLVRQRAGPELPDAGVVAAPFTDRQGQPINFVTGQAWAIPKGAKNPDGACRFAKAMTSKEAWLAAAKARIEKVKAEKQPFTGLYTGNKPADDEIFGTLYTPSGNADFDQAVATIREVQERAFTTPASRAAAEFEKAWMDAVNRVLGGSQDAETALRQAQEAQSALDKAATR